MLLVSEVLDKLSSKGWRVVLAQDPVVKGLPCDILQRYPQLPEETQAFIAATKEIISPDEKAWFLCLPDYQGQSESAYAWNEWEQQSLDAAKGDEKWQQKIRSFWDKHFPIFHSVKNGYAYLALRVSDGKVVCGKEPEFEEVSEVSASFSAFLKTLTETPDFIDKLV